MRWNLICSLAALAAVAGSFPLTTLPEPEIIGITYGQEEQVFLNAGWTAVSSSYAIGPYKKAIFLSFDGLHQFDVVRYAAKYPNSTFAFLAKHGVVFSNAKSSSPSDSYPATAAIFTGASPRTHGIWWENAYDRSLFPPGSDCKGPRGTVTDWSEIDDLNDTLITGGGALNLSALPMKLTSWGNCEVVLPHDFIRTNTVFEVGRGNGLVTAYADKHLSYEILNGPSGVGLSEAYFPEINSVAGTLEAQLGWDALHWSALRNWTNGNFVNGTKNPQGGPSLYGANFQAITFAQSASGYLNAAGTPNATLEKALQASDASLGSFIDFLKTSGKINSTLLIIGAKQGQGPIDPSTLKEFNPEVVVKGAGVPVSYFVGLDGGIMYLKNASDAQTAKKNLLANSSLGIEYVLAGDQVTQAGFGSPYLDPRVPDLVIGAKVGTLWIDGGFSFEDHGGFLPQDLDVPLIVYNPSLKPSNVTQEVSIRQIAPTLLKALGLPLSQLGGYQKEGTPALPFVF